MNTDTIDTLNVDRTVLTVGALNDDPDEKEFWLTRTPLERIHHIELLRKINYGDEATARLQRVLEIVERE